MNREQLYFDMNKAVLKGKTIIIKVRLPSGDMRKRIVNDKVAIYKDEWWSDSRWDKCCWAMKQKPDIYKMRDYDLSGNWLPFQIESFQILRWYHFGYRSYLKRG